MDIRILSLYMDDCQEWLETPSFKGLRNYRKYGFAEEMEDRILQYLLDYNIDYNRNKIYELINEQVIDFNNMEMYKGITFKGQYVEYTNESKQIIQQLWEIYA